MSTNERNWGGDIYIVSHHRGARPGQSRSRRLSTRHWPLLVRVGYTVGCGCGGPRTGTLPIEEQSGNEDRDCCNPTDDAASDAPRA